MTGLPQDVVINIFGLTDPGPRVRIEARCAWCGVAVANHTFVADHDAPADAENAGFMGLTAFDRHVERCPTLSRRRTS